jgi:N-methylhydantoinase A/oxoprolinase/acetone carboxylase beta subunit
MEVFENAPGPGLLRVGIDVGGTFTDVVALDAATRAIVARVKVPTTHDAPEGVAAGIVEGLRRVLAAPGVDPERIAFIAHSTTQATNALLEGDVASVGVLGLLGRFGFVARRHLRVPPIRLGPSAVLAPRVVFARAGEPAQVERAVAALLGAGVAAIVASEAFGVDRPEHERSAVACARAHGALATAGHDVASSYGLRARTRTAVVNAAILPRMLRTAEMTADAVARAGIAVPLMIMRSDGGVMDVCEVARRPILTMLSGPAAGIAGALLHENVSDGIFIEVGGTSADCSVIRRGLPQMRPARVGGHRTMLRTLDVRTLAIAGGSLARVDPRARGSGALRDVGPRSAHIAGLHYACFLEPRAFAGAQLAFVRPQAGDPDDYVAFELGDGTRAALTPTCAANLLGYVPAGDFARGDAGSARLAFGLLGERLGCAPEELARALLACAAAKLRATLDELIDEYELDRRDVELVGGGGGAAALVPFAAEATGLRYRLARDAEVISPVGVALALVRDVVERTIPNPTPQDVVRVRREAVERVVAAGAAPEFVEVAVELEARRNLVRATASGATAAVGGETYKNEASEEERLAAAARALHVASGTLARAAETGGLTIFTAAAGRGRLDACAIDRTAVARLTVRDASVCAASAGGLATALARIVEGATSFGDVGRALPEIYLLYSGRLAALGALAESAQVLALAQEELRGLPEEAPVAIVAARRAA